MWHRLSSSDLAAEEIARKRVRGRKREGKRKTTKNEVA